MAKTDAAREPSMEEILASIRQIISDDASAEADGPGEPGSETVDDGVSHEAVAAGGELESGDTGSEVPVPGLVGESDAAATVMDADFLPEESDPPNEPDLELNIPMPDGDSFAGPDADPDAGPDADPDAGSNADAEASTADPGFTIEMPGDLQMATDAEPEAEITESPADPLPDEGSIDNAAASPADPEFEPGPEPEFENPIISQTDDQQQEPEDVANQAAQRQDPSPAHDHLTEGVAEEDLTSSNSQEAVSGAFNALTHTILAQNARTLDDLVREMLTPMLRDWLDENLPVIVERMVKEEIDRLSRGRP